jgi:putative membrane protein
MRKIDFSQENLKKINQAVKKAEHPTTGEIAIAFAKESSDYASQELMFGIAAGFVYYFFMMLFSSDIEKIIQNMFWEYSSNYLLIFFGLSTFLVILVFYFLANIPAVDRLIVSGKTKRRKVHERAVRHFMESGIYNTRERSGILIFISMLERRVELLADRGISKKISQEQWDGMVHHILSGIRGNKFTEHLIEAISMTGDLLAAHFPARSDDTNELGDDVTILEK